MSMMKKVKTGVPGLDVLTAGGLPAGRATLVVGRSGTGKTILGLQVACFLARSGLKTIVVGIEETAEDLVSTADALGFNLTALRAEGLVHVAEMMRPLDEPTLVSGDYDLYGLVHRLEHQVKQTGAKAVVLESATALFTPRPPQDLLRSHFFQLVHCFRRLELTSIILAEAPADYAQLTTLGVEDYVCDMVVILEDEGFVVTPVASGEQGLASLGRCEFDAVLTDYSLPGGDGAWMLREAARSGRLATRRRSSSPAITMCRSRKGSRSFRSRSTSTVCCVRCAARSTAVLQRTVVGAATSSGTAAGALGAAQPSGTAMRRKPLSSSCSMSAPRPCIRRRRCGTSVRCWPSSTVGSS